MIDETTLYYYFSTVSQTIGALLGVVGAFTVFKIQRLEQDILDLVGKFYRILDLGRREPKSKVLGELFISIVDDVKNGNIKEIVKKATNSFAKTEKEEFLDYKKSFWDVQNKYNYRTSITNKLLAVAIAGMFLIFFSLSLLLVTKWLILHTYFLYIIIFISWAILVLTLSLFYKLIEKLIKE